MPKVKVERIKGLPRQYAPYIRSIAPNEFNILQNYEVTIVGAFFIPDITVSIDGCIVNGIEFISPLEIVVNFDSPSEMKFSKIIMSNGVESIYTGYFNFVAGDLQPHLQNDWVNLNKSVVTDYSFIQSVFNTTDDNEIGTAEMGYLIPQNQDFLIYFENFRHVDFPFGRKTFNKSFLRLLETTSGDYTELYPAYTVYGESALVVSKGTARGWFSNNNGIVDDKQTDNYSKYMFGKSFYFQRIGGEMKMYCNGVLYWTSDVQWLEEMKVLLSSDGMGFKNVKLYYLTN
tara:strand:+ start:245 stop:1105 length:861 start_codon:yes stop_codon:yes gene_type:complete